VKSDKVKIVFMYRSSNSIQTCSKLHFGTNTILHGSGRGVAFSALNVHKELLDLKNGSATLMARTRYLAQKMTYPIAALCL
jgi:hypothetical protein